MDEALKQFGTDDFAGIIMMLLGQPFIGTRGKFGGSTRGTSVASLVARKTLNFELRSRLPMITESGIRTLRIAFTRNLGAFVGRTIPIVG